MQPSRRQGSNTTRAAGARLLVTEKIKHVSTRSSNLPQGKRVERNRVGKLEYVYPLKYLLLCTNPRADPALSSVKVDTKSLQ